MAETRVLTWEDLRRYETHGGYPPLMNAAQFRMLIVELARKGLDSQSYVSSGFACEGEGITIRCPNQCEYCAKKSAAALRLVRSFPGHSFEARYNNWLNARDDLLAPRDISGGSS